MSAIINRADRRKTVQDARDDMAKTGTNGTAVGRKTAHDASEASSETVPKDTAATGRAVTRENAEEAAEQSLQKAAEDLRGPMERSELVSFYRLRNQTYYMLGQMALRHLICSRLVTLPTKTHKLSGDAKCCARYLFISNIVTFFLPNTASSVSSARISRRFSGFCNSCFLM
jgi:hypothetical protein